MRKHTDKEIRQYKITKDLGKYARDNFAPDPCKKFNEYGPAGEVANHVVNKILEEPIHDISYVITGMIYDKETDTYAKGSRIYTKVNFSVRKFIQIIIGMMCVLFLGSILVQLGQGRIIQAVASLLPLTTLVGIITFVRGLFKPKRKKGNKYARNER